MAEVTRAEVLAKLRELNPRAQQMVLTMYADLYAEYRLAAANIAEHGPVVFHPRTGAPIDNPYIAIRDKAAKGLIALRLNGGDLW